MDTMLIYRILAMAVSAWALAGQTPSIDQSLNFRTGSNPKISPDGRYVAYQVSETDWGENAFKTEIWLYSAVSGERYQLTRGKKSSNDPQWSPDSKWLAFGSDREGKRQIYVISPAGGEAVALTNDESGVGEFKWSPDGKTMAYTSGGPESKARKDRKEKYGDFAVFKGDAVMQHLWLVKVPAEIPGADKEKPKPEQLTQGEEYSVSGFSWSPEAGYIAYSAARDADPDSWGTADLYSIRLGDKFVKKLVDARGPDSNPVWSPDGKQIAYQTANGEEFFFYKNSRIAVIPAEGGAPRVLTEKLDEDPRLIAWSPQGIYFSALERTSSALFRVEPVTLAIERVAGDHRFSVFGASFTSDYQQAAFNGAAPGEFSEIYTSRLAPFQPKAVTALREQYKEFRLARREVIEWKSTDGTPIEGVLIKPAGYDASRKYPLLVVIHGGPTGIDMPFLSPDRTYPIERFAAKGALILLPNYRGSAGYGEKFRSLNVRNLGVGDYWDVISGVDHLIAKGLVDRDRVGAMGWSQGGYISAFITCFSDRFRAVSVGAGISDWTTYYVNTDIHPFTRQYLKATPWEDPEIYRKTSPISYVKNARTPTLIQHGEQDKRVPIPNAYQLRRALEDRGVPVRLVVYKGFGHGIYKPKEQRHLMEQNYEWFSQYIWGEKPAEKKE